MFLLCELDFLGAEFESCSCVGLNAFWVAKPWTDSAALDEASVTASPVGVTVSSKTFWQAGQCRLQHRAATQWHLRPHQAHPFSQGASEGPSRDIRGASTLKRHGSSSAAKNGKHESAWYICFEALPLPRHTVMSRKFCLEQTDPFPLSVCTAGLVSLLVVRLIPQLHGSSLHLLLI